MKRNWSGPIERTAETRFDQLWRKQSRRKNGRRRNAAFVKEKDIPHGLVPREFPMEEAIPFPKQPSELSDEETAVFLELLERIMSKLPTLD